MDDVVGGRNLRRKRLMTRLLSHCLKLSTIRYTAKAGMLLDVKINGGVEDEKGSGWWRR